MAWAHWAASAVGRKELKREAAPLFPIKKPFERVTPAIYERGRNVSM